MEELIKRRDKDGNVYKLPLHVVSQFDAQCDDAVEAEADEAIGLWIDIKTDYKNYMV